MPAVSLDVLPSGADVFLDANILVYALLNQSAQCRTLLRRCAIEDIVGVTSLHIVNEVTHRLMLAEAVKTGIIGRARATDLAARPEKIKRLSTYWVQVQSTLNMNLVILVPDEDWLHTAHRARVECGLLTNDSLIVAAARHYGLSSLASADAAFDLVPGLVRYAPADLTTPTASASQ